MKRLISRALLILVLNAGIDTICFGMQPSSAAAGSSQSATAQMMCSVSAASVVRSARSERSLANELKQWLEVQPEFKTEFDDLHQVVAILTIVAYESADAFTLPKIRDAANFNKKMQHLGFGEKTANELCTRFYAQYHNVLYPCQALAVQSAAEHALSQERLCDTSLIEQVTEWQARVEVERSFLRMVLKENRKLEEQNERLEMLCTHKERSLETIETMLMKLGERAKKAQKHEAMWRQRVEQVNVLAAKNKKLAID
jgi:hypothetical protein